MEKKRMSQEEFNEELNIVNTMLILATQQGMVPGNKKLFEALCDAAQIRFEDLQERADGVPSDVEWDELWDQLVNRVAARDNPEIGERYFDQCQPAKY